MVEQDVEDLVEDLDLVLEENVSAQIVIIVKLINREFHVIIRNVQDVEHL